MMPQISISQPLYDKIKGLAEPFVDTPESVITRCVDFYASSYGATKGVWRGTPEPGDPVMTFSGDTPPDLTFTRILSVNSMVPSLTRVASTGTP